MAIWCLYIIVEKKEKIIKIIIKSNKYFNFITKYKHTRERKKQTNINIIL